MPRRRAKKTVKQTLPPPGVGDGGPQIEPKEPSPIDQEVERQISAIRAIRDMEIERMLTRLRLFRSQFTEKQLEMPVLQFFEENFPNLSIVKNGENGKIEVRWKDKEGNLCGDERDVNASFLHGLSKAYPECSSLPSLSGLGLSDGAGRTSFFVAENMQMRDFVSEGPSDSQMLGMQDGLRTPGISSQRMSIGMTPKTLRLPKPGEMLLSVRGSPLGVYKDDNMEAIHESEEG